MAQDSRILGSQLAVAELDFSGVRGRGVEGPKP